ncbi:hypothetical protein ANCDUO_15405 [Ancylostoma duodenale]|uniref:glucuronosyltransferase n=1 Tax=Ancylostoma duodenale TaxID=51022 RepID=A0A0C2G6B9_9BILA|nr:hypothetical protein ANCDUO_15405 [Ancylostoma duodenale]
MKEMKCCSGFDLAMEAQPLTVLMPVIDYEQQDKTGLKLTKKVIKVPTDPRVIMRYKGEALSKLAQNMTKAFTWQCERGFKGGDGDKTLTLTFVSLIEIKHFGMFLELLGASTIQSLLRAMAAAGDRMTFVDRFKNILDVVFGQKFQLIAEASYVMTNSNHYLDYPRPMLHKTVPIGGVAVSIDSKKNQLSAEWDAILNERNTTVLVSFGLRHESDLHA